MPFTLGSKAFSPGGVIPAVHSCAGRDVSPPLVWSGPPGSTRSFALVCEDPDAPAGTWVHWVIFNISAREKGLPEGMEKKLELGDGMLQGRNDFGRIGYGGPCPPPGKPHRYVFTIHALDTPLTLAAGCSKSDLLSAMKGHVLAAASMHGIFGR